MASNGDNQARITPQVEDWKRELCEVFFSRIWMILTFTIVVFIGAILVVLFVQPVFSVSGSVVLRAKRPQISPEMLENLDIRIPMLSKEDLVTESAILRSNDLIRKTMEAMNAAGLEPYKNGNWMTKLGLDKIANRNQDKETLKVISMRNRLRTNIVAASNVVEISLQSKDPEWAKQFLNMHMDEYIRYRSNVVYNPDKQANFFRERADFYRTELSSVERRLVDAASTASVSLVDHEMSNNLDLKKELTGQLSMLTRQCREKERDLEPLQKAISSKDVKFFSFIDNDTIRILAQEAATLQASRAQALADYLPKSEKIRKIDEKIQNLYKPLVAEAQTILDAKQSEVAGLKDSIDEVQTRIAELEKRNQALQRHMAQYNGLVREADLLKVSYATFSKRREEADINNAITKASLSSDVSILTHPDATTQIVYPRPFMTPVFGLICGIFASLGLALVSEYMDHRIRRPNDVIRRLGLPVVCSIRKV